MRQSPGFGLLVVLAAFLACKSNEQRASAASNAQASTAAAPSAAAPIPSAEVDPFDISEAPCVLNAAGKQHVPVFPTREALAEWVDALARKDFEGSEATRKGERAYLVPSGTKCNRLDIDVDAARVRVVTGKHLGEVGWTRREWSFAKGKDD